MINFSKKEKGFTLFEVLIVFAIFSLVSAVALPYGIKTYRHYLLTSETKNVVGAIRRAQTMAISNISEKKFGVSFQPTQVVVFRGNTYATRTASYDEIYPLATVVTITAPSEINFDRISGRPNAVATITLTNTYSSQVVDLNAEGAINW